MASTPYTDGYRAGQEQALKAVVKYLDNYKQELQNIETKNYAEENTIAIRIKAIDSITQTIKTRLNNGL